MISFVREEFAAKNNLVEIGEYLGNSQDVDYHLDRHVLDATEVEKTDTISACIAGFWLLEQWESEGAKILDMGLYVSEPVLIIDGTWLAGLSEAPPPHVYVKLSKEAGPIDPSRCFDERRNDVDIFPLKEMLLRKIGPRKVRRIEIEERETSEPIIFWYVFSRRM